MTLQAILDANDLGKYHATLAAEEVTIDNIGDLTDDQLKELGLPMGARVDIHKLFGVQLQRPDGPASSKRPAPHGGRVIKSSDDTVVEWTRQGSGKKFACFLSHHKASCAMEARFLKDKLQVLVQKECFLDSDDLRVSAEDVAGAAAGADCGSAATRHRLD
jgi:hypothetical protein